MNPFEYHTAMYKAFFADSTPGGPAPPPQKSGKAQLEEMLAKGVGGPKTGVIGLNMAGGRLRPRVAFWTCHSRPAQPAQFASP